MANPAQIREGLEKLASHGTAQQVREHLHQRGITGLVGRGDRCVVAQYLVQNGHADAVYVNSEYASLFVAGSNGVGVLCGDPVKMPTPELTSFIRQFDAGAYPELEYWPELVAHSQ